MATEKFGLLCYATGPASAAAAGQRPLLPEIHLNVWERDGKNKKVEAFLDIGLMFDTQEPAKTLELIFPWEVQTAHVVDLTSTIASPEAVPAIFNESWAVSGQGADYVVYDPRNATPAFALVSLVGAWSKKTHLAQWGYGNTARKINVHAMSIDVPELVKRALAASTATNHGIEKLYTRFRVLKIERDFYCVGADEGGPDISAVLRQRTEDIDFRLNVRRGAPPNLEKALGRFVEFSKVHLFLMRSRDKEIVFQDRLFKASRSLEDEDFWARYSLEAANGTQEEVTSNLQRVKRSLGYQWKSGGVQQPPVKEFGTLARFRIASFAVWPFIFWALVLGVAGNALLDLGKWTYSKWKPDGPVEAVCVKAGEGFIFPKQECVPGAKTDASRGRTGSAVQKKE
jgi:hypothetical protein